MTRDRSETIRSLVLELLGMGKQVRIRPFGNSMTPTILSGEAVVVEPVEGNVICVGDVVMIDEGRPRLHRVVHVDKKDQTLITRGDAFFNDDPAVSFDQVVARVVSIEKSPILRLRWLLSRTKTACARNVLDFFDSLVSLVFDIRR